VYRSSDNGLNWYGISTGLPSTSVNCLVTDGGNVFAGTTKGVAMLDTIIFQWADVSSGLTYKRVSKMAIIGSTLYAGTIVGMFSSNDNGANWTEINNGLSNMNVTAMVASGSNLFIGNGEGKIYLSKDQGSSWLDKSAGFGNHYWFTFNANSKYIFAGSGGDGIWRRLLSEIYLDVHEDKGDNSQIIVYPNPSQGKFQIKNNSTDKIKFEINDVNGKLIVQSSLDAYTNLTEIDLRHVSKGIYYIRFEGNKLNYCEKIILQ
jgi:ligand-binding sensor domain-containing protein